MNLVPALVLAILAPWLAVVILGILVVLGRVRVDVQMGARGDPAAASAEHARVLEQIEQHLDRIHHQQRDTLVRTGENTTRLRALEKVVTDGVGAKA